LSFFIAFRHSFDCLLSPVTHLQLRFLSLFQFILPFTFCLLVSQSLLAYESAFCRFTISLGLLLFPRLHSSFILLPKLQGNWHLCQSFKIPTPLTVFISTLISAIRIVSSFF
jgi:hypothetical protein